MLSIGASTACNEPEAAGADSEFRSDDDSRSADGPGTDDASPNGDLREPSADIDASATDCQGASDCMGLLAAGSTCQEARCVGGKCELVAKSEGTLCDDGNPATGSDRCGSDGSCVGEEAEGVCGDSVCGNGEDHKGCPDDCPVCTKDEECGSCQACQAGECTYVGVCQAGHDRCEDGQHFTCDGCQWVPAEVCTCGCDGPYCRKVQCQPGETRLGEKCGMCGRVVHTCDNQCGWVAGECTGQGECAAGTVVPCGDCGAHKTCSQQCSWLECRGDITVGVAHAVYEGGPADDHDLDAAMTLHSLLVGTFGPQCVEAQSVGTVAAAEAFVNSHTATVFLAGQCAWGIGASALNCNGNTFACTNAGMGGDVWGEFLASDCQLDTIACTDIWLVQKGATGLGCTQNMKSCVFSVIGWSAQGTYDASVQFAQLLNAHAFDPCSTPGLTPDCNMLCHFNKKQCGMVDECNCGDCGPCQTCDDGTCVSQEGLGTPCGSEGCNECVEGAVACVGEQCGLCTQACEALKGGGCFAGADLICLAAGMTGLFESGACTSIVSTLCGFGVIESTDCHQVCAQQGWCPATKCQ